MTIPNLILNVGEAQAEEEFKWWLDVFGDDFYVQINRHNLEEEEHVNNVLISFAKKYDVLVIIVAHPTKMYRDANGKIEEPNMYNIKGGGEWYDASYHGLLVHRDYEAKNTKVKVLKVKFQNLGENGAESFFTWEPKSGSFVPQVSAIEDDSSLPWEK